DLAHGANVVADGGLDGAAVGKVLDGLAERLALADHRVEHPSPSCLGDFAAGAERRSAGRPVDGALLGARKRPLRGPVDSLKRRISERRAKPVGGALDAASGAKADRFARSPGRKPSPLAPKAAKRGARQVLSGRTGARSERNRCRARDRCCSAGATGQKARGKGARDLACDRGTGEKTHAPSGRVAVLVSAELGERGCAKAKGCAAHRAFACRLCLLKRRLELSALAARVDRLAALELVAGGKGLSDVGFGHGSRQALPVEHVHAALGVDRDFELLLFVVGHQRCTSKSSSGVTSGAPMAPALARRRPSTCPVARLMPAASCAESMAFSYWGCSGPVMTPCSVACDSMPLRSDLVVCSRRVVSFSSSVRKFCS